MSFNTIDDMCEQALEEHLAYVQKLKSGRKAWSAYEGCNTETDVEAVADDEIEDEYNAYEDFLYEIVRRNGGKVWDMLTRELTEGQMQAVADEYEYDDVDYSEQFMFELIREYYLNPANESEAWHQIFNQEYFDFIIENLRNMGIL